MIAGSISKWTLGGWHHVPKDDAWKQAHLAMLACVPRPGNPARGIGTFRPWRQQASGALIAWAA
jgi:hypothetical protein